MARRTGVVNTDGVARCAATGKRCLSRDQARELVRRNRAGRKPERVMEYHCAACTWWHYGHNTPLRRPRRRR